MGDAFGKFWRANGCRSGSMLTCTQQFLGGRHTRPGTGMGKYESKICLGMGA